MIVESYTDFLEERNLSSITRIIKTIYSLLHQEIKDAIVLLITSSWKVMDHLFCYVSWLIIIPTLAGLVMEMELRISHFSSP